MSQLTTSVQADWCCRLSPCALQSTSWHRPPACWISALSCPPYGLNVLTKAVVKVVNSQRIWCCFKTFVSVLGNLACKKKTCICMTGYFFYPIIQIHKHLLSDAFGLHPLSFLLSALVGFYKPLIWMRKSSAVKQLTCIFFFFCYSICTFVSSNVKYTRRAVMVTNE